MLHWLPLTEHIAFNIIVADWANWGRCHNIMEIFVPVSSHLHWQLLNSEACGVMQLPCFRASTWAVLSSYVLDHPPGMVSHYIFVVLLWTLCNIHLQTVWKHTFFRSVAVKLLLRQLSWIWTTVFHKVLVWTHSCLHCSMLTPSPDNIAVDQWTQLLQLCLVPGQCWFHESSWLLI